MTPALGIDPGVQVCAWALSAPGIGLIACGASRLPGSVNPKHLDAVCAIHAGEIVRACGLHAYPSQVCVEQMRLTQAQDGHAAIAKGNDLLALQAIGAFIAGRLLCPFRYLPVGVWKGTAPKAATQARVRALCTTSEQRLALENGLVPLPLGLRHNVYDACGISFCGSGVYVVRRG